MLTVITIISMDIAPAFFELLFLLRENISLALTLSFHPTEPTTPPVLTGKDLLPEECGRPDFVLRIVQGKKAAEGRVTYFFHLLRGAFHWHLLSGTHRNGNYKRVISKN